MKRILAWISVALLLGLALTACSKVTQADEDSNGQTVTLKSGETLRLKLRGNPTTGYTWHLGDFDSSVLEQSGDPAYQADTLLTGSGGTYTYEFKAAGSGTVTLDFSYSRSWEEGTPPYKTFTLTVVVE